MIPLALAGVAGNAAWFLLGSAATLGALIVVLPTERPRFDTPRHHRARRGARRGSPMVSIRRPPK